MCSNQNPVFTDATLSGDGTEAHPLAVAAGGEPGGTNTAIQFNDGGVFGGEATLGVAPGMSWDKVAGELTIVGAPGGFQEILGGATASAGFQIDDTASPSRVSVANVEAAGVVEVNADGGINLETTGAAAPISIASDAGPIHIESNTDLTLQSDTTSTKIVAGGGTMIEVATPAQIGFFGSAPIARPTVTGSRASGAALASLLTELALLGLIVDGTSA